MGNYEYIVSSLPALTLDWKFSEGATFDTYTGWIRTQLGKADQKVMDTLLKGYDDSSLDRTFYEEALGDGNRFIREYFKTDLEVRNAKARFLNRAFGRPEEQDTIDIDTGESSLAQRLEDVLSLGNLLEREHALDALMWDRIGEITIFDYFNLDAVLGFLAKLHIIWRWFALDEETGRDMFKRLVDEVRKSAVKE